ncbi:MAG: hypothetical protein ABI645_00785 [Pseudomonadota bacterium]
MNWVFFALLSAVAAGATAVFAKIGVRDIPSNLATAIRTMRLQRGLEPLRCIAIVDDTPPLQYLYPEFLLFQRLLNRQGIETIICDPGELTIRDGMLVHQERRLDFVYNRLTDFSLDQPGSAALRSAYLAGNVVVSPNPHAHALYADKRNLTLL